MKRETYFNTIIDKSEFEHYFQPIFALNDHTSIGGEFLLRSHVATPSQIFNEAKKMNRLYELDTKSILKALNSYHSNLKIGLKKEYKLFINIFPSTLIHMKFPTFLQKICSTFKDTYKHIIFEINETDTFEPKLLCDRIQLLKDYGFSIAIDDVGNGWPSFQSIIEIEPNYIKLDRYFSKNLDQSEKKQDMIKAILKYCEKNNVNLVLEGIENEECLNKASDIGVPLAQGYFLAVPEKIHHIKNVR